MRSLVRSVLVVRLVVDVHHAVESSTDFVLRWLVTFRSVTIGFALECPGSIEPAWSDVFGIDQNASEDQPTI